MDTSGIVTVRLQRLSKNSKCDTDGFLLPYGCAGADGDAICKRCPVLLLTSNIQQSAACADHITRVLNSLIDGILKSRNGERGIGFLRRADLPKAPRKSTCSVATEEIVWQNRLDNHYDVIVFRATKAYAGVIVIRDGDTEIFRSDVGLAHDAIVGPDAADVQQWMDTAIAVVDASKCPQQIVAEALDRIEAERESRIARLRTCKNAEKACELTLNVFRSGEAAVNWLLSSSALLNGRAPVDILDETHGVERLANALEHLVETIYPLS